MALCWEFSTCFYHFLKEENRGMETEKWICHKIEGADAPQSEDIYCEATMYCALYLVLSDIFSGDCAFKLGKWFNHLFSIYSQQDSTEEVWSGGRIVDLLDNCSRIYWEVFFLFVSFADLYQPGHKPSLHECAVLDLDSLFCSIGLFFYPCANAMSS